MAQRWFGARSSSRVRNDFDAAMAYEKLETPPGGFRTRDEARLAIIEMIGEEILEVASNRLCLARLTAIILQFVGDPATDQAESDGLRFAIWPVEQELPQVVTNVSDLSTQMREALLHGYVDDAFEIRRRATSDALLRRGFIEYVGQRKWKRTEAGKRARKTLEG